MLVGGLHDLAHLELLLVVFFELSDLPAHFYLVVEVLYLIFRILLVLLLFDVHGLAGLLSQLFYAFLGIDIAAA